MSGTEVDGNQALAEKLARRRAAKAAAFDVTVHAPAGPASAGDRGLAERLALDRVARGPAFDVVVHEPGEADGGGEAGKVTRRRGRPRSPGAAARLSLRRAAKKVWIDHAQAVDVLEAGLAAEGLARTAGLVRRTPARIARPRGGHGPSDVREVCEALRELRDARAGAGT